MGVPTPEGPAITGGTEEPPFPLPETLGILVLERVRWIRVSDSEDLILSTASCTRRDGNKCDEVEAKGAFRKADRDSWGTVEQMPASTASHLATTRLAKAVELWLAKNSSL